MKRIPLFIIIALTATLSASAQYTVGETGSPSSNYGTVVTDGVSGSNPRPPSLGGFPWFIWWWF